MVIFITFPDAYLHDLVAYPAEVPPFSGFLAHQVMCVVAESALTIQTQGYSAQGHGKNKRGRWFRFTCFRHINHCQFFQFMSLAFFECVPSGTEAQRALLHPNKVLCLKNNDSNIS